MNTKKLFKMFLKKHGVLKEYKKEKRVQKTPDKYLFRSFSWERSTKGFNYWMRLDIEWQNLLEREHAKNQTKK